nr:cytochrome P450 [Microbulbifer sp. GX H0434]
MYRNEIFNRDISYSRDKRRLNRSCPPGPSRLSFSNLSPFVSQDMHIKLNKLADTYGDVYRLKVSEGDIVVLNGLNTVNYALLDQDDVFMHRAEFDIMKQYPQRHFMELKSGESWMKHRHIFITAIRNYFSSKSGEIERWYLEEVNELAQGMRKNQGIAFNPAYLLAYVNLSFMQRMAFGRRCSENDKHGFDVDARGTMPNNVMNAINFGLLPRFFKLIFFAFRVRNILGAIKNLSGLTAYIDLNSKERKRTYSPGRLRDICDHLLKAYFQLDTEERKNLGLNYDDVVNGSLNQFIGSGVTLSSSASLWMLYYLMKYPDVQKELQSEMDSTLSGPPKMSDRSKLPYMQAFICEVLRHIPIFIIPAVHYRTGKDTVINGFFIGKDTPIIINYHSVTRDPVAWPDPESFDPKRFIDSSGNFRKEQQNKFFPFGIGARRCIGEHIGRMQIFLVLAQLLYQFDFSFPEKGDTSEVRPGMLRVLKDCRIVATPRR